tara:strand:- start:1017 stop:1364 length:348 start_codon:yes stop_codon:yes gene_type:complete
MKDNNKTNWMTAVLFMLTIWCLWNSINSYSWASEAVKLADNANNKIGIIKLEIDSISNKMDKVEDKIKEFDLDVLPFGQAFNKMHGMYGEEHVFDWRNELYTTKTKEGETIWQQQ